MMERKELNISWSQGSTCAKGPRCWMSQQTPAECFIQLPAFTVPANNFCFYPCGKKRLY